jgi:hypothetical protein
MVTGFAFFSFLTFMLVVLFMAREAIVFQLVLVQIPFVATNALGINVLSKQGVFGLLVMIEHNRFPALLRMTDFALCTETTLMFIVLLVA